MNLRLTPLILIFYSTLAPCTQKNALILGIMGQDGTYLADFLLKRGYNVYGVDKKIRQDFFDKYFSKKVVVQEADITDSAAMHNIIHSINPDEIYNLAAQSIPALSYEKPELTTMINAVAPLRILEILRSSQDLKKTRFFQASSCDMFGDAKDFPQHELSTCAPQSPYAISKYFAHLLVQTYRRSFGMFTCNGILFNHESPRRPDNFISSKIVKAVVRIKKGDETPLEVGNLDALRDWGHARDYVKAMWLMLQQNKPDDFIIASGEIHSVREFIEVAFKHVGIDIIWHGKGVDEQGVDKESKKIIVKINSLFFRPGDESPKKGDITKAEKFLQWHPETNFRQLISEMVEAELCQVGT